MLCHTPRFALPLAVAMLCLTAPVNAQIDPHDGAKGEPLSITVTGEGEANAVPDVARINIGVVTGVDSAQAALEKNNQAMSKLFATLEKRGIKDKDIQTTHFSISPRYRHDPNTKKQVVEGYVVSNQVTIEVKRTAALGELLDEVVSDGANNINGISFDIADPANLRDQARRDAIRNARQTAELYARQSDMVLAHPLRITEHGGYQPMPRMDARVQTLQRAEAVPIAAGEHTVRATVTVVYAMTPAAAAKVSRGDGAVEKIGGEVKRR
jgi:hypothetical protein